MYAVPMNDKIKQKTTTILALIIATIAFGIIKPEIVKAIHNEYFYTTPKFDAYFM
jgi:hypothetical protein